MSTPSSSSTESTSEPLRLRVEFELGIPEDTSCPLFTSLSDDPQQITVDHHDGTCFIEVELSDCPDGEDCTKVRFNQPVANCSCPAFWKHGSFQRVLDIRIDDSVTISETYVPDRETLRDLVSDIRETGRTVRIRKLTTVDDDEHAPAFRVFDTSRLTEKEREMLQYAVEAGYYDRHRKVSLQDVAEVFGVTKQTCSERLGVAESKITKDLFQ
ncbi:MAG: helix-turn-helix domain-containing protein [Halobacteriota archaeon]